MQHFCILTDTALGNTYILFLGDQLLIIGGVTTMFMKTLNNVECYCCDIGKWMKGVSALPYPVSGHGTVSLPPANLLINH